MRTILDLSNDTFNDILSLLSISDVVSFGQTCKHVNNLVRNLKEVEIIDIGLLPEGFNFSWLTFTDIEIILENCEYLKYVRFPSTLTSLSIHYQRVGADHTSCAKVPGQILSYLFKLKSHRVNGSTHINTDHTDYPLLRDIGIFVQGGYFKWTNNEVPSAGQLLKKVTIHPDNTVIREGYAETEEISISSNIVPSRHVNGSHILQLAHNITLEDLEPHLGHSGLTGATGPTGAIGPTGPTGSRGVMGVIGPIGMTGYSGKSSPNEVSIGPTGLKENILPGMRDLLKNMLDVYGSSSVPLQSTIGFLRNTWNDTCSNDPDSIHLFDELLDEVMNPVPILSPEVNNNNEVNNQVETRRRSIKETVTRDDIFMDSRNDNDNDNLRYLLSLASVLHINLKFNRKGSNMITINVFPKLSMKGRITVYISKSQRLITPSGMATYPLDELVIDMGGASCYISIKYYDDTEFIDDGLKYGTFTPANQ